MSIIAHRLYTADQVRQLDRAAVAALGIESHELMERAGRAAFDYARASWPGALRWWVLCGAGNNAGDGYVVARLAHEAGLEVAVQAVCPVAQLSGDAARAAQACLAAGVDVQAWQSGRAITSDLAIDALLGTGLNRAVEGEWRRAIEAFNASQSPRLALDVPSGLSADTGGVWGTAVRADHTVTFVGQKRGLLTAEGPDHAGRIFFADLGIPLAAADDVSDYGELLDQSWLERHLSPRRRGAHKGDFGHVLVTGGAPGMSGAARLAGEAALRAGSGLVTVATHPAHAHWLNLARPELMTRAVADNKDFSAALERATVLAIGPGLGQDAWAQMLWQAALAADLPTVIDADALNLLAERPVSLGRSVITPHPGEAARLLGTSTRDVQSDRFKAARALAQRFGAVTVLKGCGTVVSEPGGKWALCALGSPGMATGGSGDVLTGVIAALLAQGFDGWLAACLGVIAHAAAGQEAAEAGERGMIAGDIAGQLRKVMNV